MNGCPVVLVIEDSSELRQELRNVMTNILGLEVAEGGGVRAVVESFTAGPRPDLALVNLDGVTGAEAVESLKRAHEREGHRTAGLTSSPWMLSSKFTTPSRASTSSTVDGDGNVKGNDVTHVAWLPSGSDGRRDGTGRGWAAGRSREDHVDIVWSPPWNPTMMSEEAKLDLGYGGL